MNFINTQHEDMENDNESCILKTLELKTKNKVLNNTVTDLNMRLNQVVQQARRHNIEL